MSRGHCDDGRPALVGGCGFKKSPIHEQHLVLGDGLAWGVLLWALGLGIHAAPRDPLQRPSMPGQQEGEERGPASCRVWGVGRHFLICCPWPSPALLPILTSAGSLQSVFLWPSPPATSPDIFPAQDQAWGQWGPLTQEHLLCASLRTCVLESFLQMLDYCQEGPLQGRCVLGCRHAGGAVEAAGNLAEVGRGGCCPRSAAYSPCVKWRVEEVAFSSRRHLPDSGPHLSAALPLPGSASPFWSRLRCCTHYMRRTRQRVPEERRVVCCRSVVPAQAATIVECHLAGPPDSVPREGLLRARTMPVRAE